MGDPTGNPACERLALKARWVFPVTGNPIPDGIVSIEGERIAAVGWAPAGGKVRDLGNVAILPGLVNAHTHLEFSLLEQPLGARGMSLVTWIPEVIDYRREFRHMSPEAVRCGLEESLRCGTTTLGEIAQPDWSLEPFVDAGLQAVIFLELIALTPDRVAAAVFLAQRHLDSAGLPQAFRPGLGPHAPYSVDEELLGRAIQLSRERSVPIAFHLAESRDELQWLRSGTGWFADLLSSVGGSPARALLRHSGPQSYLRELAAAHRVLIIHGNYLEDDEIALLGSHAKYMSVVYCPRTHAYFEHAPYPLEKCLSSGVTMALGTDSRASSPDLSVLAEMRLVAKRYPSVPRSTVLRMGTLNGARALGLEAEVGSLEPGKRADLAIVALPKHDAADPHELLLKSDEPVVATWIGGRMKWEV